MLVAGQSACRLTGPVSTYVIGTHAADDRVDASSLADDCCGRIVLYNNKLIVLLREG